MLRLGFPQSQWRIHQRWESLCDSSQRGCPTSVPFPVIKSWRQTRRKGRMGSLNYWPWGPPRTTAHSLPMWSNFLSLSPDMNSSLMTVRKGVAMAEEKWWVTSEQTLVVPEPESLSQLVDFPPFVNSSRPEMIPAVYRVWLWYQKGPRSFRPYRWCGSEMKTQF